MSLSSNYPTVRPSLLLDFANTKTLDPRITFTRASTATYYDGKTVAKAEENLLVNSQDFDASWSLTAATITANSTTAPDGTTTADIIVEDTASSVHRITRGVTTGGVLTASCYAKVASGTRYLTLGFTLDASNFVAATFDVSAGTVTQTLIGLYTSPSASIVSVGNGWYRCILTATTSTAASCIIGLAASSTFTNGGRGNESYVGNGTSSLYIWGAQLEQRSAVTAYTPTTTPPITNYIPQLMTAASGVARFDHNPTTDESLGLLIEEARTNSLTYSSDFDNAAWAKSNATVTANTSIAPDGTLTVDKLVEDATASVAHLVQYNMGTGLTTGAIYAASVYVKTAEITRFRLRFGRGTNYADFNLTTQAVVNTGVAGGVITSVGNGWYRCSVASPVEGTAQLNYMVISLLDSAGNATYTGNGYNGLYIWGAQLELGAFATSYIPTTTAAVARPADVAVMTGTNFSSWYTVNEGTMYAEGTTFGTTGLGRAFVGDQSLRYFLYKHAGNNGAVYDAITATISGTAVNAYPAFSKLIMNYGSSQQSICVNGGAIVSGVSSGFASSTALAIGGPAAAASYLNGTIKKIAFYPKRFTDNQLKALTTV